MLSRVFVSFSFCYLMPRLCKKILLLSVYSQQITHHKLLLPTVFDSTNYSQCSLTKHFVNTHLLELKMWSVMCVGCFEFRWVICISVKKEKYKFEIQMKIGSPSVHGALVYIDSSCFRVWEFFKIWKVISDAGLFPGTVQVTPRSVCQILGKN